MFLYLSDAILDDLKEGAKNFNPAITAIEYLAIAHIEGKHLVTGSRDALNKITSLNTHLSTKNIAIFRKILQEVPQYGSAGSRLTTYSLIIGCDDAPKINSVADKSVLHIPLSFFNDTARIQPVNFIAENSDDTKFISHLCRAYSFENRLHHLRFNFNPVMGGGDQTAKEYKASQDKGVFTICIVDSDRKYPKDNIGETARKVVSANNHSIHSDFRILDCRELENLISEKQLCDACAGDATRMRAVNFIRNLEQNGNGAKRFYLDFKNGLKLLDIYSYGHKTQAKNFWGDVNGLITGDSDVDNDCISSNQCNKKKSCLEKGGKRSCKSIVMHSLGDKICESVVNILNKTSPQKICESLCVLTRELWNTIGAFVFSWSCCGNRLTI